MAGRTWAAGLAVMVLLGGCARVGEGVVSARVRVMTYNVNWGAPAMEQTVEAIRASGADVVCLQETTKGWEERIRAALGGVYPHMLFRHHLFPAGGMAVLSRWEVVEAAYVQPLGGWFPAWVLGAQTPVGEVQVVVVHLHPAVYSAEGARHVKRVRREEMKSLWSNVKPGRATVVLGDFNERREGLAVRHLLDLGYVDAVHAFDSMVAKSQGAAAVARDCVDHILFSRELEGYRAELLEGGGSDHPPVMGEVGRRGGR